MVMKENILLSRVDYLVISLQEDRSGITVFEWLDEDKANKDYFDMSTNTP